MKLLEIIDFSECFMATKQLRHKPMVTKQLRDNFVYKESTCTLNWWPDGEFFFVFSQCCRVKIFRPQAYAHKICSRHNYFFVSEKKKLEKLQEINLRSRWIQSWNLIFYLVSPEVQNVYRLLITNVIVNECTT